MKNLTSSSFIILSLVLLHACYTDPVHTLPIEGIVGAVDSISVKEIPTASEIGGESNLFADAGGGLYLSWMEYEGDTADVLLISKLEGDTWSAATEVARGDDWFVNWADFPSVAKNGELMAANWLQKSAQGTYDYDIHISLSQDAGKTWGGSFVPHRDSIAAEHGFVSFLPLPDGKILCTWLDGRKTKEGIESGKISHQKGHEHGHGGPMTLRVAEFGADGTLSAEAELDDRVCDCCPTDAAFTANGPVIAYRDRGEDETRDIYIVRKENGKWSSPQVIYPDNWKIAACPVNGPALAANGNDLAVAWFTIAGETPQAKITFSTDGGKTFDKMVRFDDGQPDGRVDVEWLDKTRVLVTWMENIGDRAEFRAKIVSKSGEVSPSFSLARLKPSRASGFPALAKVNQRFYLSWTDALDSLPKVRTAELVLE